jgi:signal transduction histidine kinase
MLKPTSVQALRDIGLSVEGLVRITVIQDILVASIFTACALIILLRKPNDPVSIFVTIVLVTFGIAFLTGGLRGIVVHQPELGIIATTLEALGIFSLVAFLFVFPSGHFTPRGTAAFLAVWVLIQLPWYYFPDSPLNLFGANVNRHEMVIDAGLLSGVASQIYRFKRVSQLIEQQQTKWVVYGLAIGYGTIGLLFIPSWIIDEPLGKDIGISLALNISSRICFVILPLSIAVAVLRFRLWDINPIINRTLVYGTLSASTMALYLLVVGFFSNYFQSSTANFVTAFLATGMIAILFQPLRERLQRGVNHLMYGERDDPAMVLARLSRRLDSSLATDSVLPTIVETVAQTLRLPYTAITLFTREDNTGDTAGTRIVAEFGYPSSEFIHFPLTYQTNQVGELLLAPRAPGESLSPADIHLLGIIAQQAGVAAHGVQLTEELLRLNADLQQSRQRLVAAQAEERRRLRRDLHDGIGPTLASLSQRMDTAADLVASSPQASVEMLKELKGQVKGVLAEIRQLVYNLRPPVLDEFGLVSAIREHIAPYTGPNGLQITLNAPELMPSLSAALEVAAYRIALEAFTNVVQHAQASSCQIDISVEDNWLFLQISDDGKALSSHTHSGVGFTSMRERANELGGELSIEENLAGGLCVCARLPLPKE